MISVIIPTLNEEKTISKVIQFVKNHKNINEIIVVDDKSIDNTINEAKNAGATKVITSTKIGKGASMRDGFLISQNKIIMFLDADIENYPSEMINKMISPILNDEADFVKGTFEREAGRVTELVAKPLLSLLFPQISNFSQPLSGMIAGKREIFEKVVFEDNYGVDIGLLIDIFLLGARIKEVNIGYIKNKMKQWRELGQMSKDVARAILKRASQISVNLDTLGTINIIRDQMQYAIKEKVFALKKIIIFDMDNTIFNGRFIEKAALIFGFKKEFYSILTENQEPYIRTKLIAKLFKNLNISQILAVVDDMQIVPDFLEVINELKKRDYIIGIISDSYDCVVEHIKNKVGADFALGNELIFSNSIATGEVTVPSFFLKSEKSKCNHNICKSNAVLQISEKYNIELSNIIAVGDSENDICMVKTAGIGVAFCSKNDILNSIADQIIEIKSFKPLLKFAL